jgi:hypothetical protein
MNMEAIKEVLARASQYMNEHWQQPNGQLTVCAEAWFQGELVREDSATNAFRVTYLYRDSEGDLESEPVCSFFVSETETGKVAGFYEFFGIDSLDNFTMFHTGGFTDELLAAAKMDATSAPKWAANFDGDEFEIYQLSQADIMFDVTGYDTPEEAKAALLREYADGAQKWRAHADLQEQRLQRLQQAINEG